MAIEASPEVFNSLLIKLGAPPCYEVHDVLGMNKEDLERIPGNLHAIILLLPKDEIYNTFLAQKNSDVGDPHIFFIHQGEGAMCGTIVLIHAIVSGNNHLELEDGPLKQFLDEAGDLGPEARGELLARSEAVVRAHYDAVTSEGGDQGGDHHLVCFVRAGDQVYDMDSLASKPHWVAECGDTTFPSVAITAARAYLDRNPGQEEFNILALVKNDEE